MDTNEIKNFKGEISTNVVEKKENIYGLASLLRIFFARLIDVILSAIPSLIVVWTVNTSLMNWRYTALVLGVGLAAILFFMVVIPWIFKGSTLGKLICGIRLKRSKGDKKVKWYMLLAREVYFMIIPWAGGLILWGVGFAIFNSGGSKAFTTAYTIANLGFVFMFLWIVFVFVTIKVQAEHQSGIDMKFGLYVVYKEPVREEKVKVEIVERNIVIPDAPGDFDENNLKDLRNDEQTQYDKSISLDDLDINRTQELLDNKKKNKEETKGIEGKDK